jgi:hypothetical protein
MMADYTNILQELRDWKNDFGSLLDSKQLIGTIDWQPLWERLVALERLFNDPVISEPLDNYKVALRHPIDACGMTEFVVQLVEKGSSESDISRALSMHGVDLTARQVGEWITAYRSAPIMERVEYPYGSVFDTQTQLQTIFNDLKAGIIALESADDEPFIKARKVKEEIWVTMLQEQRQLLKDARALMETVKQFEAIDRFKQIVIEEVNKENPAIASRIYRRIQMAKTLLNTLEPLA